MLNKIIKNDKLDKVFSNILKTINGDGARSGRSKLKASLFAILIGLLIGILPIVLGGGNPLQAYQTLFFDGFTKIKYIDMLSYTTVFMLLGLGIAVSFKTGLFNIGAAGQFMLAGAVTTIMGIQIHGMDKAISIPILILISAVVGAALAGLAGGLKAFFNVHEVVSTILLNWSVFYLIKYIFQSPSLKGATTQASKPVLDSNKFDLTSPSNDIWIVVAIGIMIVLLVWFLFKFTTFGYTLRVNGMNKDAAKYGGINTKNTTLFSMMISGAIIGVGGFIYYSSINGQMEALDNTLQPWGFEAITVTLLAFSSPLSMPFAALFYAAIKVNIKSAGLSADVTGQTLDLVLGVIILFAAIAPILEKIKPFIYIRNFWAFHNDKSTKQKRVILSQKLLKLKKQYTKDVAEYNLLESKQAKIRDLQLTKLRLKYEQQIKKLKIKPDFKVALKKVDTKYQIDIAKIKQKNFLKSEQLKSLQENWKNELLEIKQAYLNKKIAISEKDLKIRNINISYKRLIDEKELNKLDELKNEYLGNKKELKSGFGLYKKERILVLLDLKKASKLKKNLSRAKEGGK